MSKKPFMKVTADFTREFNETIQSFKNDRVLVGVPAKTFTRVNDEDKDNKINNATLLAIHEYGSPANNIPARPVMSIGIKDASEQIGRYFGLAAKDGLEHGTNAVMDNLEKAGTVAAMSIKKTINSQHGIDPPSEATIAAREQRGFKGKKALLVSGQLRNSITHVVQTNGLKNDG